ncbi:MAG TPA: copper homeostasis protein CutC [Terracidiphilus sp.]|jgi:copper homeostasis protein|nr:copper homeostasis protein CutC [Terracidiphilus sp.]
MKAMLFELCAENLESAIAAQDGGADRIELCADLAVGGLTPPPDLMTEAVNALDIPVHVLIRPRAGDFVFSCGEFDDMRHQIDAVKRAGASGIATGILLANGCVDIERTRALIDQARPMDVTFHRAFDETPGLAQALEDVIEAGADSLLTSGGAPNVLSGAATIRSLAEQAGGRIPLIAGGGLRLETLAEVIRISGIYCLHGSLSRRNGNGAAPVLVSDIREAVRLLRAHAAELVPPAAAR